MHDGGRNALHVSALPRRRRAGRKIAAGCVYTRSTLTLIPLQVIQALFPGSRNCLNSHVTATPLGRWRHVAAWYIELWTRRDYSSRYLPPPPPLLGQLPSPKITIADICPPPAHITLTIDVKKRSNKNKNRLKNVKNVTTIKKA